MAPCKKPKEERRYWADVSLSGVADSELEGKMEALGETALEWLANGLSYDAKQHLDSAREVKIAHGMKPKK